MNERFYPVILAVIAKSQMRMRWIRDQVDYDLFYLRFKNLGADILEIKTIESIYRERMSKFYPELRDSLWTFDTFPGEE